MRPPSRSSARSQNECNRARVVADEQHGMPGRVQLPVARLAALLESRITDGEDLVEDQDFAHRPERDRVGQPRRHAARVMTQFEVGKSLEPGELEDRRASRVAAHEASGP